MADNEFPDPQSGFVVTHFLVVSDQDRSREFYRSVFGATVLLERDPVIMRLANSWLILNAGGGPTDDKPTVTLAPPEDPDRTSAFLNLRVANPKTVKNRVHLDLTCSAADRDQEITRLLALGARRVDIGQTGTESWTVLADPEGNEFCVVRPKETLIR